MLGLRLLTYIQDDGSHLFIALTPNEHHDYPRRAPFVRPPLVWSSSSLVIITLTSRNWIQGCVWQLACGQATQGSIFMANRYPTPRPRTVDMYLNMSFERRASNEVKQICDVFCDCEENMLVTKVVN